MIIGAAQIGTRTLRLAYGLPYGLKQAGEDSTERLGAVPTLVGPEGPRQRLVRAIYMYIHMCIYA